jgi:hypothetical protein
MDRIEEIIQLEKMADRDDGTLSQQRWRAAKLIWEEIQEGATKASLAERIGKSRQHVLYMWRSWDLVGRNLDYGDLPPFNGIYSSSEVRGEPQPVAAEEATAPRRRRAAVAEPTESEEPIDPRRTVSLWIDQIEDALNQLTTYRIAWEFATSEDLSKLGGIGERVRTLGEEMAAMLGSPNPV